jgi:hypothetical protein
MLDATTWDIMHMQTAECPSVNAPSTIRAEKSARWGPCVLPVPQNRRDGGPYVLPVPRNGGPCVLHVPRNDAFRTHQKHMHGRYLSLAAAGTFDPGKAVLGVPCVLSTLP